MKPELSSHVVGKEAMHQLVNRLAERDMHFQPLEDEPRTWTPADGDTAFSLPFDPSKLPAAAAALADVIAARQIVRFYKADPLPYRIDVDIENSIVVTSRTHGISIMVVRNYSAAMHAFSWQFHIRGRASEIATRVRSGRELLTV